MSTDKSRMKLWSIGGGKGGIGKSLITLGLGVALARLGNRIILVDGDLGGANLHTLMGVRYPHVTLEHFLTKKVAQLEDTIIETPLRVSASSVAPMICWGRPTPVTPKK